MLNKADFEKLDERLKNITMQPVEQIAIDTDVPPTIEDMEDNNKTYVIQSAILFIDIRKSTYLTENSQAKSMVKISPSLPADENHLPNRLPNFAIPFVKCDVTRPFSSVLLWGYLTKKSYVPYTKPESPVITVTWKQLRLIFPNSALRIRKNRNWLLSMQPVV